MNRRRFLEFAGIMSLTPILANLYIPEATAGDQVRSLVDVNKLVLADRINATLKAVGDWAHLVNVGTVMGKSSPADFDKWITSAAKESAWTSVFEIKRHADHSGYSSQTINDSLKLALSNMPMFKRFSLPITENDPSSGVPYFWTTDRHVLHGYRYAKELNWETQKWNAASGFLGLKSVRDKTGSAFYEVNPDSASSNSMFGTRWHEAGNLMDSFLILHRAGVSGALDYAVQEWQWLNSYLWSTDHYDYAPQWRGWEFSAIDVFPNVAKVNSAAKLESIDRVATDLQNRYLSNDWLSPQWNRVFQVVEHLTPKSVGENSNPQRCLDGTLGGWILSHAFYGLFSPENQAKMKSMLQGEGQIQAYKGLLASDLYDPERNSFRLRSNYSCSDEATAQGALTLFLIGISPQDGMGLAIPMASDNHSGHAAVNSRHFGFDYARSTVRVPVWAGTTLAFLYGENPVRVTFESNGIHEVSFTSDWNSLIHAKRTSYLSQDECYLLGREVPTYRISYGPVYARTHSPKKPH